MRAADTRRRPGGGGPGADQSSVEAAGTPEITTAHGLTWEQYWLDVCVLACSAPCPWSCPERES